MLAVRRCRLKLTAAEQSVLMLLATYTDDTCRCWPAVSTLAADAKLTERTVRSVLHALRDHGLISIERRHRRTSVYTVRPEIVSGETASAVIRSKEDAYAVDTSAETDARLTGNRRTFDRKPDQAERTRGSTREDPLLPPAGRRRYEQPQVSLDDPRMVELQRQHGERAGALVERFQFEWYPEHRTGRYAPSYMAQQQEYIAALQLCDYFTDHELEQVVVYFLRIPDGSRPEFEGRKTRTLKWCLGLASAISRKLGLDARGGSASDG